jgi:hypothetical protein
MALVLYNGTTKYGVNNMLTVQKPSVTWLQNLTRLLS